MESVTLGELRNGIKDRAELPTLTATTFITSAEMQRWINQSAKRLMALMISAYGEGHFVTQQTLTTTADQQYSVLPVSPSSVATDMFRIIGLRVTLDGTRVQLMRAEAELIDTEDDSNQFAWTLAYPPRWQFRELLDQRFLWSRTPQDAHVVTIHYVPYFLFIDRSSEPATISELTDDSDHHIRSWLGYEEWVVLDCAIKALKRQTRPAEEWQALKVEQQEIEAAIKSEAPKRTDQPKRIRRQFNHDDQLRRGARHGYFW